jgi:hypothetical protein
METQEDNVSCIANWYLSETEAAIYLTIFLKQTIAKWEFNVAWLQSSGILRHIRVVVREVARSRTNLAASIFKLKQFSSQNIVTYRPAAEQRPRNGQRVYPLLYNRRINKRPFISNGSVNTFPQQQTLMQQYKDGVFYVVRAEIL